MSNNTTQMLTNNDLDGLLEGGELTAEEAAKQPQQQNPRTGSGHQGKVLKIQVFEGSLDHPKVCVAFPLGLAKWAGRLLPQFAKLTPLALDLAMASNDRSERYVKLIHEKYAELDFNEVFTTICEVIEDGIDELEEIGKFDFVTVQDGDTKVLIGIE